MVRRFNVWEVRARDLFKVSKQLLSWAIAKEMPEGFSLLSANSAMQMVRYGESSDMVPYRSTTRAILLDLAQVVSFRHLKSAAIK